MVHDNVDLGDQRRLATGASIARGRGHASDRCLCDVTAADSEAHDATHDMR